MHAHIPDDGARSQLDVLAFCIERALDELAASPIGSVHAGALSLGARSVRRAITKALGVEP